MSSVQRIRFLINCSCFAGLNVHSLKKKNIFLHLNFIFVYSPLVEFTDSGLISVIHSPTLFPFPSLIVSQTCIYLIKSEHDTDFDLHRTQMIHFWQLHFFSCYGVKSMLIYVISIAVSKLVQKLNVN